MNHLRIADDNILVLVPGQFVAQAVAAMGPPDSTPEETAETTLEVERIGLVRFTAAKKEVRHQRHRHRFWSVSRAVRVTD